jgi:hypothetical protein
LSSRSLGLKVQSTYRVKGMVLRYSIVHVLGLHNRIRATNQINHLVQLSAQDICRISKDVFGFRPVVVQTIMSLQHELKFKKNNVLILPIATSLVHKDTTLMSLYKMNRPIDICYRNLYFYIPPIGHERQQTLQDIRCMELLKYHKIPSIPEYPLAGTEIQKENLLRKYLLDS